MERGEFLLHWKTRKVDLIKKPGCPAGYPSAYRSIVLLDEVGKLFERVIALAGGEPGPGGYSVQFAPGVLDCGRHHVREGGPHGEIVVAVSPDIARSFNTQSRTT